MSAPRQDNQPTQRPPPHNQDLGGWKSILGISFQGIGNNSCFPLRITGTQWADHHLTSRTQYLRARSLQQLITPLSHVFCVWPLWKSLREFAIFFSCSLGSLFIVFMVSFAIQKLVSLPMSRWTRTSKGSLVFGKIFNLSIIFEKSN